MKEIFKCNICESSNHKLLKIINKPDRFELAVGINDIGYERKWIECQSCGIATNMQNSDNNIKLQQIATNYYNVDFKESSIEEKYYKIRNLPKILSDNAQRVERILFFFNNFQKMFRNKNMIYNLVDIGAGTGIFASTFLESTEERQMDWKVTLIESDPLACKHLRKLEIFKVVEGSFPNMTLSGSDFNLCTLNKVIEHISNPVDFLKSTHQLLSNECALLYVEVPDKLTINYREGSDNILGSLHKNLYCPKSLAYVVEKAEYIPLQISRFIEPSGKITVTCFATQPSLFDRLANTR